MSVIDDYVCQLPEPARSTLIRVCSVIRSVAPEGTTEIFSYRVPTFHYKGPLIGFAAFATHCSLFPFNPSVMEQFPTEFAKYELSKGTIRFPLDKPIPAALLKKLVKARIAQNESKKQKPAKR